MINVVEADQSLDTDGIGNSGTPVFWKWKFLG